MWGLPQKQNARRADKIRLCGHLRRYKKIVKKTYIIYTKFFIEKKTNKTYGLIGGKTNYNNPDISLHDEKENERRFGRLFMKSNKEEYEMSNMILVVHHKKADEDSMQAFFIERYVQRKYNLFDS